MLGGLAKFLLVATSVAPVLFTWAFADWRQTGLHTRQIAWAAVAFLLWLLCYLLLRGISRQIPKVSFRASAIRGADTEVVGFMLAYLLPLVSTTTAQLDYAVLAFVAVMLSFVVWASDAYTFNPLLTVLRYHFFEVTSADGVTYVLVTQRKLRRTSDVTTIGELTGSLTLDLTEGAADGG